MLLVAGALIFRSYQRSTDVIGDFKRQQVQNGASPAIERAKAKLEYLFEEGIQTTGVPSERTLEEFLAGGDPENSINAYQFPDEEFIGDSQSLTLPTNDGVVPAWTFETDTDGDGTADSITAYAILARTGREQGGTIQTMDPKRADDLPDQFTELATEDDKANYMVVSNGPLSAGSATDELCEPRFVASDQDNSTFIQGWFEQGSALLRKNFQVYAVTIPKVLAEGGTITSPSISTLLYQQDRTLERANKWGAWFRTDIELYTGPTFRWNGAIHTEGTLFARGRDGIRSYLISAQNSCFYDPALNSEVRGEKQIVSAIPGAPQAEGNQRGNVAFDLHGGASPEFALLNPDTDSVNSTDRSIGIMLDPEKIVTQNASVYRDPDAVDVGPFDADVSARINRGEATQDERTDCPPYIDDTYRADNIRGPKPGYSKPQVDPQTGECSAELGGSVGAPIGNGELELIRNEPPPLQPDSYGLDGYWERRARGEGLRIIVGERLELGNAFGWTVDLNRDGDYQDPGEKDIGEDPLNPHDLDPDPVAREGSINYPPMNQRKSELVQRRTLRDNLAAVQATAIYHHSDASQGYHPVAYVATTVHPGTSTTLQRSSTFEQPLSAFNVKSAADGGSGLFGSTFGNDSNEILIDFLTGRGTNGWEFNTHLASDFEPGTPLWTALQNLANFTGDRDGAYPPNLQCPPPNTTSENLVGSFFHPDRYPDAFLTMWGNFSNLQCILFREQTELPSAGAQGEMSLAHATTFHTAAGTLGMLAYNIAYLEDYDYTDANNKQQLEELDNALQILSDGNTDNGEVQIQDVSGEDHIKVVDNSGTEVASIPGSFPTREAYLLGLEAIEKPELAELARLLHLKEQVKRDREFGFAQSPVAEVPATDIDGNKKITGGGPYYTYPVRFIDDFSHGNVIYDKDGAPDGENQIKIGCDFSSNGNDYFGFGDPGNAAGAPEAQLEKRFIDLATLICSTTPKFPSLHYIFPTQAHDRHETATGISQPTTEPYISNTTADTNFEPVNPADIALMPKPLDFNSAEWFLPTESGPGGNNPNNSSQELVLADGALRRVAIKDSALYDGREAMSVRTLNLDLELLRENQIQGDFWLPESGIVFAFREDAVREDALYKEQDPNDLRIKAVDYYPDPDRRPYGFRFKNGRYINRGDNNSNGMTFITDNPLYIQGAFNLHATADGATTNEIQEFTQTLPANGNYDENDFYGRTDLNPSFSRPGQDNWRPVEVLADAITILSDNFCDGSIEDGIIYSGDNDPNEADKLGAARRQTLYGCNNASNYTSYLNQNRPSTALDSSVEWQRENPFDRQLSTPFAPNSPILISRNGIHQTTEGDYDGTFLKFADKQNQGKNLINPIATTVNLVLVSGISPTQENQLNGGLHNFPRLLENWNDTVVLTIQGSLMQLNFSNYATAPFDQDGWEDGQPTAALIFPYYSPPQRNWGYDVGLQYLPAGPVSKRLVSLSNERDEFYRELPADDRYICKLRDAIGFGCQE
jgi:hypothetical protein